MRLLVIGDAGVNTGFERVVRGVVGSLHGSGKFEIIHRGISWYTERKAFRSYPWEIKSWGGAGSDPLGVTNVSGWLKDDRPDAVIIFQDLWNVAAYRAWMPRDLPVVSYSPVDCPNVQWIEATAALTTTPVAYTRFAAREVAAGIHQYMKVVDRLCPEDARGKPATWVSFPNPTHEGMSIDFTLERANRLKNPMNWHIVPHALERGVFEPRDKRVCRRLFGLPEEAFVLLNVNTNQFRKRQDATIRAFQALYAARPDAYLVLHCQGSRRGQRDGYDLYQLADYYGVADRVVYTHAANPDLTDDELCSLYNTADLQINTAGGEGWGLSSFEGAACGIPQFVPDWGGLREVWQGHGVLLPVSDWRHEIKTNAAHAILDMRETGKLLVRAAGDPDWLDLLSQKALAHAEAQITWDHAGQAFSQIIDLAVHEPPPVPYTVEEVLSATPCQSAVAERLTLEDWAHV